MIYFTSDEHHYHKNIIKFAQRPFDINDEECVINQSKLIINKHNEIVKAEDLVIHVGDLSCNLKNRTDHFKQLLNLYKGRRILIRGNHDKLPDEFYLKAGFEEVLDYKIIGEYFICHFPLYINSKWCTDHEKELRKIFDDSNCTKIIHGHVHNKNPDLWESDGIKRFNVCVDYTPNNFYPVKIEEI